MVNVFGRIWWSAQRLNACHQISLSKEAIFQAKYVRNELVNRNGSWLKWPKMVQIAHSSPILTIWAHFSKIESGLVLLL